MSATRCCRGYRALDELTVVDDVVLLDVGEETATLPTSMSRPRRVWRSFWWTFMCSVSSLNALGQDGDLDLGVAGVDRGVTELGGQLRLALFGNASSRLVSRRPRATLFASTGKPPVDEHPRSRYQQVGMLPQAARTCASSPTQHEFHRTEPLIGMRGGPNMRKPQQKRCGMRIESARPYKGIERHGH